MPRMLYDDTIAAIATPPGPGGIGIVRLSGPEAPALLARMFRPSRRGVWQPARMRHGHIVTQGGETLDEALAVRFHAPHSFTAEDVVEFSCHGGPLVISRVLALALEYGARPAEPGEFTMRAFLNGRIDLAQAEATLDVVNARTAAGLAQAQAQLGGWLSTELAAIRELILGPLAYCTALVDFPEDEIELLAIEEPLAAALARVERLLASADQGVIYRRGVRAAIVGLPNAGKSSLLNALLRADRAIVTSIPGTTRDTLEETANIGGVPVVLVDTAGIAETTDPVERIGVVRSRQALAGAELALVVIDITNAPGDRERAVAMLSEGKPALLVLNKCDLMAETDWPAARAAAQALRDSSFAAVVEVSALTGAGIDRLVAAIAQTLLGSGAQAGEQLVTSERHQQALLAAAAHLGDALGSWRSGATPDLLCVDLTAALVSLGEITGETVGDDLLHAIFSRFCIGK